jgi:peroxiredoxin
MPGAFTPTCSQEHLPGYVKAVPKLKKLGIEKVRSIVFAGYT